MTKEQTRVCRESLLGPGPQLADPQSASGRSPPRAGFCSAVRRCVLGDGRWRLT